MNLALVLGVGLVGGLGAVGRFVVDGAVAQRLGRGFPFGTLLVNVSGTFALGLLVGAAVSSGTMRLAGTGLIGAYTTFSTWTLESHRLGEDGQARLGALNFVVSLIAGLGVAWLGRQLGTEL